MIFHGNGKLLLSGEYLVLKGARSLAIPTKFGQSLIVDECKDEIQWKTYEKGLLIFKAKLASNGSLISNSNKKLGKTLSQIFKAILEIKGIPEIPSVSFTSKLDFSMDWGIGSSSTLIYTLAKWANIDPFVLLDKTFGGSGYDIACASASGPIIYELINEKANWNEVAFSPPFKKDLHFVYLNTKMNSRDAIKHFNGKRKNDLKSAIQEVNSITDQMLTCSELSEFGNMITHHEEVISDIIKVSTIKKQLFSDYTQPIKSLGGWGGDFVLVIGNAKEMTYFRERGYNTIIPYSDMELNKERANNEGSFTRTTKE